MRATVISSYGQPAAGAVLPKKVNDMQKVLSEMTDTLTEELGLDKSRDVIEVPVLLDATDGKPIVPNAINMQVIGNVLVIPNQFARFVGKNSEGNYEWGTGWGIDHFGTYITGKDCLGGTGLKVVFVDSTAYRVAGGHIHCATNVIRDIPTKKSGSP